MLDLKGKSCPSDKEIREFWEWCGFTYSPLKCDCSICSPNCWVEPNPKLDRNGSSFHCPEPELDLNNLFKYAVPKLRELKYYVTLQDISKGFHCSLVYYTTAEKRSCHGESNDPALALFWAIWEYRTR